MEGRERTGSRVVAAAPARKESQEQQRSAKQPPTSPKTAARHQRIPSKTTTAATIVTVVAAGSRSRSSTNSNSSSIPQPPPTPARHRRLSSGSLSLQQRKSTPALSSSKLAIPVPVSVSIHADKESAGHNPNHNTTNSSNNSSSTNPRTLISSPPARANIASPTAESSPATKKVQQLLAQSTPRVHRRHTSHVSAAAAQTTPSPQALPAPTTTTTTTTTTTPPTANSTPDSAKSPAASSSTGTDSSPRLSSSTASSPSPPKKRAPARFSSNGVATSAGPPPSLAFRRRFTVDNRGMYSSASTNSTSSSTISAQHYARRGSAQGYSRPESRLSTSTTMEQQRDNGTHDYDEEDDEYGEKDRTIRGFEDLQSGQAKADRAAPGGEEEDVFLKLARSDTVTKDKLERRKNRLSQYRKSLPADTASSPLPSHTTEIHSSPPQANEEVWRRTHHMSSPADSYRARRMSIAAEQGVEERTSITPRASYISRPHSILRRDNSPGGHSREFSTAEASPRTRASPANGRDPRTLNSSPPQLDDRPRSGLADSDFPASVSNRGGGGVDSASTVSTTAASSVWDELDDLKSRIRRLEVTGRMPASGVGNGSNSSGERPRTATTTITTISSSPRHNASAHGTSPVNSSFSGSTNTTTAHPLLHAALAKSKVAVPPEIYRHLELAAKDALDLSTTVGTHSTTASSDRTARRKADGVCRSLTELCIALTESRHTLQPQHAFLPRFSSSRPTSRGFESNHSHSRESLRDRIDTSFTSGRESITAFTAGRDTVPSVLGDHQHRRISRYAERKGSLASLNTAATASPPTALPSSPTVRQRTSMLLKSELHDPSASSSFRAPSRASTEVRELGPLRERRQYSSLIPGVHSSPGSASTAAGGGKRYFSGNGDGVESGERLRSVLTSDNTMNPMSSVSRLRSGSVGLGRNATTGMAPGGGVGGRRIAVGTAGARLRESVELDSINGRGGGAGGERSFLRR